MSGLRLRCPAAALAAALLCCCAAASSATAAESSFSSPSSSVAPNNNCTFVLNGTAYDLSALATASDATLAVNTADTVQRYYVRLCANGTSAGNPCAAGLWPANGPTPVCQAWGFAGEPPQQAASLGTLSSMQVAAWAEGDVAGLRVSYSGGTACQGAAGTPARRVDVEVACDYEEDADLVLDSASEEVQCAYVLRARSRLACPSQCGRGFGGAQCDRCLPGYYGPNCTACDCVHGDCADGLAADGRCSCDDGWEGTACDTCAPGRCSFVPASGKYKYELAALADEVQDYSFVDGDFLYTVNVLGPVVSPCPADGAPARNVAGCQQYTGISQMLGTADTATFEALSGSAGDGDGLRISYTNGTMCGPPLNKKRAFDIILSCNRGMSKNISDLTTPRARITSAREIGGASCVYEVQMESAFACPECNDDVPRYGIDCTPCDCGESVTCDSGVAGTGRCSCGTDFAGPRCDECAAGRYGESCDKECDCDADRATCDDGREGTGKCLCFAGWTGDKCKTTIADMGALLGAGGIGAGVGLLVGAAVVGLGCMCHIMRTQSKRNAYSTLP